MSYDAVEYVERRFEIHFQSDAVHLQQSLAHEQSQKHKLGVIYTSNTHAHTRTRIFTSASNNSANAISQTWVIASILFNLLLQYTSLDF